MEKRLLVLGGGRHQKNLICQAEERGVRVVVSDYYPDAPGKQYASYPTNTDALDIEANIKLAREYDVSGVITIGTDMAVVTMAEVADALGLPCYLTPQSARLATDKLLMKRAFVEAGIPICHHEEIARGASDLEKVNSFRFPVVVKPSDSQGQRGVCRVDQPRDVVAAIASARRHSRTGNVIVEEFLRGYEFTVSAWVCGGELVILAIADRVTYNPFPAIGICFQHIFPSLRAKGLTEEIAGIVREVVHCYGVREGPLYIQMIVQDGNIRVVEAACRVGGGHEESSIPISTGVDVRNRLIDLALAGRSTPIDYEFDDDDVEHHVLVNFLLPRPGVTREGKGFHRLVRSGMIEEGEFYFPPGYTCPEVTDGVGRVGYFIVKDKARDGLLRLARSAYSRLELVGSDGMNLLFWPPSRYVNG